MRAAAELELRKRLKIKATESRQQTLWAPYANSPQEMAVQSEADILGYGGAAGGGKSDTLIGIPVLGHRKARIFRREYGQLDDLIDRAREIIGKVATENKNLATLYREAGLF
jgi:hypothetical protein